MRRLRATALTEFVLVTPMMLAGLLGIITFSMAMFGQQMAANAAAHAARVAAITQSGRAAAAAVTAAQYSLQALPLSQSWTVRVCQGDITTTCVVTGNDAVGATARVEVLWETPNFLGTFLPGYPATPLRGTAAATYRNEGW